MTRETTAIASDNVNAAPVLADQAKKRNIAARVTATRVKKKYPGKSFSTMLPARSLSKDLKITGVTTKVNRNIPPVHIPSKST
jgi:hypothetical protein